MSSPDASEHAPVTGSCFCGEIQFEVRPPTVFCGHCHCSMCRRSHGAAFVTWFGVPKTRFRITRGRASLTSFRSSDHGSRSFCSRCGSSLFCEIDAYPDVMDVVLSNLHGPIDRLPEAHFFYADRVRWFEPGDSLPKRDAI